MQPNTIQTIYPNLHKTQTNLTYNHLHKLTICSISSIFKWVSSWSSWESALANIGKIFQIKINLWRKILFKTSLLEFRDKNYSQLYNYFLKQFKSYHFAEWIAYSIAYKCPIKYKQKSSTWITLESRLGPKPPGPLGSKPKCSSPPPYLVVSAPPTF